MRRAPVRRRARLVSAGLALALLPTVAGQAAADAGTPTESATSRPAAKEPAKHTVTLLTGDKVTVTDVGSGKKTVDVERPPGAQGAVRTHISGERITVVPDEVRPFLASGALDRRLFEVTELIQQGYDDKAAPGLPLIVSYGKNRRSAPAAPRGAEKTRSLPSVNGAAIRADRDKAATFWRTVAPAAAQTAPPAEAPKPGARTADADDARFAAGIEKIWLDGRVEAAMAESNAQIGSPKAWEAGITGKGVKVAVLDSGIDAEHPDIKGRLDETKSFIEGEEVADRHGHGTHVASTVAGTGAASDGKEKGVAHGARLAIGKVLSDEGFGFDSQIIAGMEWAAKDADAKVINMSLGSNVPGDGTDPMSQAVNSLSQETGALFVIAAGNAGYPGAIGSPGAADSALTIGAVDSEDRMASFTSQGPRSGDNGLKPDLSGPGVDILAARSQLSEGSGAYRSMSGTSMATPHVAGAAALLAEQHPDWTGQQLKDALMSTSKELNDSPYALGAGRVSASDAVDAQVTATGSADLGFFGWPYEENEPVARTVTYANSSDEPVTLKLAAQVEGPDGQDAPAGVVKLADTTVTVPANGTAQTTVTGDGTDAAVGQTTGRITATAGDTVVAHTAVGMVKEEERYTLTVHVKDRDGKPTAGYLDLAHLTEGGDASFPPVDESGTVRLRLKPGMYSVMSYLDVRGSAGKDSLGLGLLGDPEVVMDRDRELTLDARKLREITAEVPLRTEDRQRVMEYGRSANGGGFGGVVQMPLAYDSIFAAPLSKPANGTFEYRTNWRLGKPTVSVKAGGKLLSDPRQQVGSTLLEGRHKLAVVNVGTGSSAAYAGKDVRGTAVVARRSDAISPQQLAEAATAAGAKALFVTDDVPGRLSAWFGTDEGEDIPLFVASLNAADGARLIAAAGARAQVELTGTANTPYVYDLSDGHVGAIPQDLTYAPKKKDLAVIDSRFHSTRPEPGGEFRYAIPDRFPIGIGFLEKIDYPSERTDYVTVAPGLGWHESVQMGPLDIEQRSGVVRYEGGSRSTLNWFKPVLHPWLGTGLGFGQQRSGNSLQFNTPGWGDSGPDHTGFGDVWHDPTLTQFTEVWVDGERVDRSESSGAYAWDVGPEEKTFKIVTDTTREAERWKLATKGHSEWTIRSAETPDDRWTYLPVLNLGFDVDTDLAGDVRGGKRLPVGIFSEYIKGVPAADTGKIGGGKLEVSYDDGATWASVALDGIRGKSAAWEGGFRVPKEAEYISLRASATDDQGGSVTQEIIRAVGVK